MPSAGHLQVFGQTYPVLSVGDWSADLPPLVLYNLHYFDDLTARHAFERSEWHAELIERWIHQNPPGNGPGWDPYTLSLRIVNWIKWHLDPKTPTLTTTQLDSLMCQTEALFEQLEYHLLGNHLLANAKGLVFAGAFFDGPFATRWLKKGLAIFKEQLPEQILADGGHFELSPMYHSIILEDVLDLVNLDRAYPELSIDTRLGGIRKTVSSMQNWLSAMTHRDGKIAFFNDAAHGIAIDPDGLKQYSDRLELPAPLTAPDGVTYLADSGYIRIQDDDVLLLLDVAEVGPAYQPGHAHADTLSMEMSLGDRRLIVNSGTSQYGISAERNRQRSTAAHSTVEVDGQDSSETWSGFRVARRAHPGVPLIEEQRDRVKVQCAHDGYRRLSGSVLHERTWELSRQQQRELRVSDQLAGSFSAATARFYIAPGWTCVVESDADRDAENEIFQLRSEQQDSAVRCCFNAASVCCRPSTYHPRFGVSVPNTCLESTFLDSAQSLRLNW